MMEEFESESTFEVTNTDENDALEHIIDINDETKSRQAGEIPHVIEIASSDIIKADVTTFAGTEGVGMQRWSLQENLTFLEAFKAALESKKGCDHVTKKYLFIEGVKQLKERGIGINVALFERKYNNMATTYNRCRKKYVNKKNATPNWPYYKPMRDIELLLDNLSNPLEDISRRKRIIRIPTRYRDTDPQQIHIKAEPESADYEIKYVKILPKPTNSVSQFVFHSKSSPEAIPSVSVKREYNESSVESFKEKRLKQENYKLTVVDDLVQDTEDSCAVQRQFLAEVAAAEELECKMLGAIRDEIMHFRNDIIKGMRDVKLQLQTITQPFPPQC